MRDDFSALHSDDALLDALGARARGAALGVAAGVDPSAAADSAARLLAAWAQEIDTRPGPLAHLLGEVDPAARTERPLTAVKPAVTRLHGRLSRAKQEQRGTSALASEAIEPVDRREHSRPRRSAMPRVVAAATAGVLVLGLGGVAAAVSGGTPFESLRRVVGAAPEISAADTPAQRASALLAAAEDALDSGNLTLAAERLAGAQELLPQVTDAKELRTLRAKLAAFRARWEKVLAPVAGAVSKVEQAEQAEKRAAELPGVVQKRSGVPDKDIVPDSFDSRRPQLVPEAGMDDPSDKLTLPDPGLEDEKGDRLEGAKQELKDTRDELKNRAGKKVEQLPKRKEPAKPLPGDLPGPLDGRLGPDDLLGR